MNKKLTFLGKILINFIGLMIVVMLCIQYDTINQHSTLLIKDFIFNSNEDFLAILFAEQQVVTQNLLDASNSIMSYIRFILIKSFIVGVISIVSLNVIYIIAKQKGLFNITLKKNFKQEVL